MAFADRLKDTRTFVEECWLELRKVTWPDKDQLRSATLVVIVFTIAISLLIWLMDGAVRVILDLIMGLFGA